jgi:hypothetical protein
VHRDAVHVRFGGIAAADALGEDLDAESARVKMTGDLPRVCFDAAEHGMVVRRDDEDAWSHRARTVRFRKFQ